MAALLLLFTHFTYAVFFGNIRSCNLFYYANFGKWDWFFSWLNAGTFWPFPAWYAVMGGVCLHLTGISLTALLKMGLILTFFRSKIYRRCWFTFFSLTQHLLNTMTCLKPWNRSFQLLQIQIGHEASFLMLFDGRLGLININFSDGLSPSRMNDYSLFNSHVMNRYLPIRAKTVTWKPSHGNIRNCTFVIIDAQNYSCRYGGLHNEVFQESFSFSFSILLKFCIMVILSL